MHACHEAGIKVAAWGYVYGDHPEAEADMAIDALKMGADAYIWNCEKEFKDTKKKIARKSARILCSKVRNWVNANQPTKLLGYSTFCRVNEGIAVGIPFDIFDFFSDVAMPQVYWKEFRGWTAENAAFRMMEEWRKLQAGWKHTPRPIIPTLHAYIKTPETEYVPPAELAELSQRFKKYGGINYYLYDKMGQEHWKVLREAPFGRDAGATQFTDWTKVAKQEQVAKELSSPQIKPTPPIKKAKTYSQSFKIAMIYLFIGVVLSVCYNVWDISVTNKANKWYLWLLIAILWIILIIYIYWSTHKQRST